MRKLIFITVLTFVSLSSFAKAQFHEGFYIDIKNNKVEGYILYRFDQKEWFKFKKEIDDKAVKMKPQEVKSFTIHTKEGTKECVTLYNFTVKVGIFLIAKEADFAEVIIEGEMMLFKHYSIVGNAAPMTMSPNGTMTPSFGGGSTLVENYLIKKGNNQLVVVPLKSKRKFRKRIGPLFEDNEKIKSAIDNKKADKNQLEILVNEYNKWVKTQIQNK